MSEALPPIVVVAYNRPRSLDRLLRSLGAASYPDHPITLIISIDKGPDNQKVVDIAHDYDWQYGEKEVLHQEKNLGLKTHILQCGDLSLKYGNVVILEDDLFVSQSFYFYSLEALTFTKNKEYVGGISLYNHQFNVHTGESFNAIEDGYDNWYFQFASSWGQAWSKAQWEGFKNWYVKQISIHDNENIPQYVRSWSDKSWLKLYIAYLIDKERYFLYPMISYTTNFSDAGTHVSEDSTLFQVPLVYGAKTKFSFSELKDSISVYDAFFENTKVSEIMGYSRDTMCLDLYGYKPNFGQRFWLSSKVLDYQILRTFGRSLKPLEANILCGIDGTDFFLYDTSIKSRNNHRHPFERRLLYSIKQIAYRDALKLILKMTLAKRHGIIRRLKNL
ncbi:Glycosyl transferase family 2 [Muriicola jejuensis]|uniref:Glycosyltransferase n=1 Tax=Muriicola jejuensis TaxID=504488 RepID=A0A6P0UGF7_9FLAO|nr:glycosyltransferase family A protein [Muriicola jejuensis]NER11530.1 glycosyltransferase [Muriicola jejuensis]SMP19987.1 Glycosyl transferase family 2 [Muriicola jejuensis]